MLKSNSGGLGGALGCAVILGLWTATSPLFAQAYLDNETLYQNQDPNTETRRSDHFRMNFGHFNRDTGTPMTEELAQGNLVMYEQMWNRWVNEMGLHDINESVTAPDGNKYRANFNFLMTWNDGGGGGAYSSMDPGGFFYAMANSTYCRFDPPSGATPHEFGHVWEGSCAGFNGTDSSGSWWECTANWMLLQFLNSYPQAGGYLWNGMYYPAHGRDYYDSWMIYEAAHDDPRYGAQWVNNVWTNANADQRAHEFILDRMIRCDTSGSPDKAGAMNDLWGDMARKMVTWDFQRQPWLATVNSADDGRDWYFYQRCRTPLVQMPGTNGWFRPARAHLPMEFGFNMIPLAATPGTTVTCNFQPQCDPFRQSDWRACLVAVSTNTISAINTNSYASYSTLWNRGANSITLSADQTKLYLVVIATPKPMKIADPAWQAYLTDAGLQFPYAVSFSNATPRNVVYAKPTGVTWKNFTNTLDGTVCKNIASGATVAATAYVSSNAMVLNSAKVLGNARIEDYAVIANSAQVRDSAVVSGHAVVQDNAQVYGHAKVRDWARVFGYVEIFENGRVIEHGNCGDGDASTHTKVYGDAVVKGTTYVYNTSAFNGCLIMDGDSANGNGTTANSKGVHFGWGWGQDLARFNGLPDNKYLFTQFTFEKDNPVFAMDQYGINHGFLMNDCRATVDTIAPTRGGRVLALDGIHQYVELHNAANDFKSTTIALWVKPTGITPDQRLWSMGDGTNKVMFLTPNDGVTGGLRFVISNSVASSVLDGGVLPVNAWSHVAVVFDGSASNCTLYVNGLAVATNNAITLFPESLNAPLMQNVNYLGRGNDGNYFQGYLDDFRVYMKSLSATEVATLYSTAAPASVTPIADTPPPAPTWLVAPEAISDSAITMSAIRASSALGWSEYYFECTSGGGHDSGWVSFNKYTDVGLTPGTAYTYTVKMRDRSGNITAASAPSGTSTAVSSSGTASFAYGPVGIASGQILMTAATVTNASGKTEYKFDRSGKSSGWISSPSWKETGLTPIGTYTYTVTVRDGRGNTSAPSSGILAKALDYAAPLLPIPVAHWQMQPYATISNSISMTAQTSSDPGGVQYYFRCVSGGGPDSGWQSSSKYVTPPLADGTYVYEYQLRDQSAQFNTNASPSTSYAAVIKPTTGYHSYTLSQVVTNQDDYLVSFPATVMRVNTNNYFVQDLISGAEITVEPATSNLVTIPGLALKNVTVQGHLYTRNGSRVVTWSTVISNGVPTLYTISGKVTNSLGNGISGATVYFSDSPNASSSAVVSATTDAGGNFSKGVPSGSWYVAAGASAYNTSADRFLLVNSASVSGVDFGLVSNAVVHGIVTRRSDGTPVSGAVVYFSRTPGASGSPTFTTTTAVDGTYARAVQNGVWYVAAGGSGFYTSPDLTVTMAGVDVNDINFALKSSALNVPQTTQLLFSAMTDVFPASGPTGDWPSYQPAGRMLTNMSSPTVEIINGVKWESNVYAEGDGYRQGQYSSPIAVNGASIIVAVKPKRNGQGTSWTSCVDVFYDRLVLGVKNDTGKVCVRRNGTIDLSSTTIPDGQPTILSLVVQPNGQYKVWANGVQIYNNTSLSALTTLSNGVAGGFANVINVGRNDPDGWTTFNGNIGDVFVYTNALADVDRQTLETNLMAKFVPNDYQIIASANSGGTLNPSGIVPVAPGGTQSFAITPSAGNVVSNVVVDGVSQGALSSYTFSTLSGNHTISASFALLPPPTLTIAPNGAGGIDITWPDTYSGTLMTSPVLGSGASWTPVGGAPVHISGFYRTTVTPGDTNAFYRLEL